MMDILSRQEMLGRVSVVADCGLCGRRDETAKACLGSRRDWRGTGTPGALRLVPEICHPSICMPRTGLQALGCHCHVPWERLFETACVRVWCARATRHDTTATVRREARLDTCPRRATGQRVKCFRAQPAAGTLSPLFPLSTLDFAGGVPPPCPPEANLSSLWFYLAGKKTSQLCACCGSRACFRSA